MTLVLLALFIGLGVMFGMGSLIMDLGYGMGQIRAMQNGTDAGAMAAARKLAGSVAATTSGGIVYVASNGDVHETAREFAFYNHPAALGSSDYEHIAVQFLPCSGSSPTPNWSAQSDAEIVAEVGGSRQATTADYVPAWTCKVRIFARVAHHALLASALRYDTVRETARTTAAIVPAAVPTTFTDVWPITRWVCNGNDHPATTNRDESQSIDDVTTDDTPVPKDQCDDEEPPNILDPPKVGPQCVVSSTPQPCPFWDSNASPQGDFKKYVDLSRFSGLAKAKGITRAQHLEGWSASCAQVSPDYCAPAHKYDPATPPGSQPGGSNDKNKDVPYWIRNGWKGVLKIDENACVNVVNATISDPTVLTNYNNCQNSRLEIMEGDLGNNIADAMRDFIDLHKEAGFLHSSCGSGSGQDHATATVFLFRWGEQDTANNNDSIALNDASRIWGNYKDDIDDSPSDLNRVIVQSAARFKFCKGLVAGSAVKGFFVSFFNPSSPPSCAPPCTPSAKSNTVLLVE